MTTFSCRTCGSPSFTICGDFTPRAEVCCTSCGAALGTWETVLGETMGLLERLGVPHRRRGASPLPGRKPFRRSPGRSGRAGPHRMRAEAGMAAPGGLGALVRRPVRSGSPWLALRRRRARVQYRDRRGRMVSPASVGPRVRQHRIPDAGGRSMRHAPAGSRAISGDANATLGGRGGVARERGARPNPNRAPGRSVDALDRRRSIGHFDEYRPASQIADGDPHACLSPPVIRSPILPGRRGRLEPAVADQDERN